MSLDGIKSHKLLQDRERGSSLKWRITVVSCLRREPKFLFCLPKWIGLRKGKEDFRPFFELVHEQETLHFAYSYRLKRKGVWKKSSVRSLQICGLLQPQKILSLANQCSTNKSTRKGARASAMTGRSVQSILRTDFKMFPCKITVMHLSKKDEAKRHQFTAWAEGKMKFFWTYVFWARFIFIWKILLTKRTCSFVGRNSWELPRKKQSQREYPYLGCHAQP